MFWGRGSNSTTSSALEHNTLSRQSDLNSQIPVSPDVPISPSYVLSEQRRNELLLAARTNRVAWVDGGVDQRTNCALPAISSGFTDNLSALVLPSHCHDALASITKEVTKFFSSLDDLKLKIMPHDLHLTEELPPASKVKPSRRYRTLFHELREQETLLNQWQRSHSPRTKLFTGHDREMAFLVGFRELVTLMKSAKAAELVYRIQSFVKRAELWDLRSMLNAVAIRHRPGGQVQAFIKKLVEQIKLSQKLRALLHGEDEGFERLETFLHVRNLDGEDLLHEVLEAFLMEKLYAKTLSPSKEVAEQDEAYRDRVNMLGFVTFQHLDLPVPLTKEHERTWLRLTKNLKAMTLCPSPRRKMDSVLRLCQDLTTFLKQKNGGKFPSADEFLPALIYVVLRANPSELKRNVAFILEYRNPAKLVSEPGYFFTHLVSSVAFLEEVNGSCLTISADEFNEGLRRSKENLRMKSVHSDSIMEKVSLRCGNTEETAKACQKEPIQIYHSGNALEGPYFPTVLEVRARRLSMEEGETINIHKGPWTIF